MSGVEMKSFRWISLENLTLTCARVWKIKRSNINPLDEIFITREKIEVESAHDQWVFEHEICEKTLVEISKDFLVHIKASFDAVQAEYISRESQLIYSYIFDRKKWQKL